MPEDSKFNEEEMLHLFSAMMGATEKEEKEAIAEVKAAPAPLPAKPEQPTAIATPSAAPPEKPAPTPPPAPPKEPETPRAVPPSVKMPEAGMIPPPPPPPVEVDFDPSELAVEEPEAPPPPPPPGKPTREQLKQVEELGHQFEIGRSRMRQVLIPFIGERVTKKMLAWSLERVQKTHTIFKNVHWSSQGELHDDGVIEIDRLVKNVQDIEGQDVVALTKAAMLELLKARVAAVEQGLGASLRQAVEREVKKLEEFLG